MRSVFLYWHFGTVTLIFLLALCFVYMYIIRFRWRKKSFYFLGGVLVIIVSVASPLHFMAENYFFSAHMITHVLLILVAAPLLVAGIPKENRCKKQLRSLSSNMIAIFGLCWFAGIGIMWFWHIPYVFNKIISDDGMDMMYLQWFSLLLSGVLFYWPIINPYREYRLSPLFAVLYLSTACVFCTILGLMITFAPSSVYIHHLHVADAAVYTNLIGNRGEISIVADQQAAGLIMWVPCCMIYLTASMFLLVKWFRNGDATHPNISDNNRTSQSFPSSLNF